MFQIILGRNSKIEELSHSRLDETYLLRGQTSKTAQPSSQSISVTLRGLNYIPNQDPTVLPHGGIYTLQLDLESGQGLYVKYATIKLVRE